MKSFLAIVLLTVDIGCSRRPASLHPLDGKPVVLEGRWNALAKERGQLICDTDPKVVDVVGVDHLATPKHEQFVRVTAVLHWRGMDPEERRRLADQTVQLIPDGYVIRWSEAKWEVRQ